MVYLITYENELNFIDWFEIICSE